MRRCVCCRFQRLKESLINCARYSDGLFFQGFVAFFIRGKPLIANRPFGLEKYACQNDCTQFIRGSLNWFWFCHSSRAIRLCFSTQNFWPDLPGWMNRNSISLSPAEFLNMMTDELLTNIQSHCPVLTALLYNAIQSACYARKQRLIHLCSEPSRHNHQGYWTCEMTCQWSDYRSSNQLIRPD